MCLNTYCLLILPVYYLCLYSDEITGTTTGCYVAPIFMSILFEINCFAKATSHYMPHSYIFIYVAIYHAILGQITHEGFLNYGYPSGYLDIILKHYSEEVTFNIHTCCVYMLQ